MVCLFLAPFFVVVAVVVETKIKGQVIGVIQLLEAVSGASRFLYWLTTTTTTTTTTSSEEEEAGKYCGKVTGWFG